jgi:outer membrane protein
MGLWIILIYKLFTIRLSVYVLLVTFSIPIFALNLEPIDVPTGLPDHIVGDVGIAVYTSNMHIGTEGTQSLVLPYGFFDYKRFFARIDEVGFKTFEMGYGYFEVVGKIDLNSYKVRSSFNGTSINKSDPIPLGLGTYQETPIGGFFANAYHDFGKSKGMLYELLYFAEIETYKNIVVYPEVGIERQSNQYANYYYGINSGESNLTGYNPYTAPATNNLIAGFMLEIPVVDNWYVNLYGRRKWLGSGINNSPVLNRSFQDNIFAALAYRFK